MAAIVCLVWLVCAPLSALAAPPAQRQVLILNAYEPTYAWTASVIEGIRAELDPMEDVELSIEFMDTKKAYTPSYAAALAEVYAQRYGRVHFDLIISADDDALDFLLAYRDELFPGVPTVFCGINGYRDGRLGGQTGFTGVNEETDIDRSLDLIAAQLPATKRIVLVADQTATGVAMQRTFARRRPAWDRRFTFTTLTDVTTDELATKLRALPPDAVVLWGVFMRDRTNTPLSLSQSLRLTVEASPVPVYGFWDFAVQHGVVGGFVASGFAQGQTAAKLGRRILAGEGVDGIAVVRDSPNVHMFDHKAMRRFGIESVPPGSLVRSRPSSFFEEHRAYVWAALVGMGAETVVILGLLGLIAATTRRSRAKLRESEARYRTVISSMSEGLLHFGDDGALLTCNPAAERILGRARSELPAWASDTSIRFLRADGVALPPDELPGVRAGARGEAARDVEIGFDRPDGTASWISVSAIPLGALAPHPVVVTFSDVTEKRRREEALREALAAEKRFLATMSHEIRTPLFGIIGSLDLLASVPVDPAHQGWIDNAQISARHLLSLLNDILDVSKMDAGQIELGREAFDLDQLLADCAAITRDRVRPGVELRHEGAAIFRLVVGDPTRVRQIVLNLLGNAAKFTERGRIKLRAAVRPGEGGRVSVGIDVEDSGVGIPEAAMGGLFQQFRQAHGARYGGTGMGLYLTRSLARLMGGDVTVESVEGRGSHFHVELSLGLGGERDEPLSPRTAAEPRDDGVDLASMRVLVVDDVSMNLRVTGELFRTFFGITPDTAANGLDAVSMVQRGRYDLVLMDLQMPVMDGASAARRIRELGIQVPIVAMTASAMSDEIQAALDAGMNGFLNKPARRAELLRVLVAHAGERRTLPSGAPPVPQAVRARAHAYFAAMVGEESARVLVEASVESLVESVASLRHARAGGDLRLVGREYHKLKGALLNCGLDDLAAQAAALEQRCATVPAPSSPPRADALEAGLAGLAAS